MFLSLLVLALSGCLSPSRPPSSESSTPSELRFEAPAEIPATRVGVAYEHSFCRPPEARTSDERGLDTCAGAATASSNPSGGTPPYQFSLGGAYCPTNGTFGFLDCAYPIGFAREQTDFRYRSNRLPTGFDLRADGTLHGTVPEATESEADPAGMYLLQICVRDSKGSSLCDTTTLHVLSPRVETLSEGALRATLEWACHGGVRAATGSGTLGETRSRPVYEDTAASCGAPAFTHAHHSSQTIRIEEATPDEPPGGGARASAEAQIVEEGISIQASGSASCGQEPETAATSGSGVFSAGADVRPTVVIENLGTAARIVEVELRGQVSRSAEATNSRASANVDLAMLEESWIVRHPAGAGRGLSVEVNPAENGELSPGASATAEATGRFVLAPGAHHLELAGSMFVSIHNLDRSECPSAEDARVEAEIIVRAVE